MLAVSLYFFVDCEFWGRVAFRVRAGVKVPRFQVVFSWGVRVLIVRSSGGDDGDFDFRILSVERVMDLVVFPVEN